GLFWWNTRTGSPASLAHKKLEEADRLAEAGDLEKAAALYRDVGQEDPPIADEAAERFKNLLETRLEQASLRTIKAVVRLAVSWPVSSNLQLVAYERGLQLAADRGKDDPHTAAAVLETIRGVASDPPEFARRWRSLLEEWRAAHSEDLELVCALAVACEYQGD